MRRRDRPAPAAASRARRRRPRRDDVVAEAREADVDHRQRILEQGAHVCEAPADDIAFNDRLGVGYAPQPAQRPSARPAPLPRSCFPRRSRPRLRACRICAARSCGSPSVPQTWPISASVRPCARASRCAAESASARRAGGVRMRAVAQHDVDDDRGGGWVRGVRAYRGVAQRRIDHRMRAAARVVVVAHVDEDVPLRACGRAAPRRRPAHWNGRRARGRGKRAAPRSRTCRR